MGAVNLDRGGERTGKTTDITKDDERKRKERYTKQYSS